MSHTRIRVTATMVLATSLIACGEDPTTRIAGSTSLEYGDRPPVFNAGCNGVNGSQLRASSSGSTPQRTLGGLAAFGERPHQLEQVVVYGNPVQRPRGGYGAPGTYGGVTQTFIYDRDALDQCSFGTDNTFSVVGPVADDTLDVPVVAPDSIPQDVWNSLPPAVKKQLREAAWYLADHFIPNDMEFGSIVKQVRRALFFKALANGYQESDGRRADRRRETEMFEHYTRGNRTGLSRNEVLRVDALLMGCMVSQSFRQVRDWNADVAESYASRVVAGWASDATQDYAIRFLEPQLSRLGAIGAELGREGMSCAQAARYHFENRTTELYDPSQGGSGGSENPFLF